MSVDTVSSSSTLPPVQATKPVTSARDKDGDNDNDTTESASAKAKEAANSNPLPDDSAKGRNLNITA